MTGRPPAPSPRRWLGLGVLCLSLLIVTLDNTVLNVVLPTLVRELHATTSQLQWIVDAYVMVFAGLLLVAGSAADRLGRKRTLLAGLAAFAAGSTWAAFSGSVSMLIAARASMGIGGALIMPSTAACSRWSHFRPAPPRPARRSRHPRYRRTSNPLTPRSAAGRRHDPFSATNTVRRSGG